MRRPGSTFSTFTGALVSVASRFDSEYIAMIDSRYHGTASYLGFFSFILDVERKGQRAATSKRIERSSRVELH